jgi:23S rRNA 5-hydroxycytidine C2501 synthase
MKRTGSPVELLAPARDVETGTAAINCGADAVYIGASRFGAREAAGNPLEDIEALCKYAHRYWGRVYAVVNTLLYDGEIPEALKLIWRLYEAGVDALILQDVGLLECELPSLPLFASTQMHNHTLERVQFLEAVGFQRAILARELTLEQIREIRQGTRLELETFIHGALCVSYSGQCSMSYALGGRSGNHGQCAQPCRRRYRLLNRSGRILAERYLLSLRDLNLSADLGSLLEAGVRSFKIEGRLKDRAYVMNVVSHYRGELDRLLETPPEKDGDFLVKASSGKSWPGFKPNLEKTFNRGYTQYYLNGRRGSMASPETPKWRGETIGMVRRIGRNSFGLDRPAQLNPGDGLAYFDPQGELQGTSVQRVQDGEVSVQKMEGLAPGAVIYRNHDQAFLKKLDRSQPQRTIGVHLKLQAAPGGLELLAEDEDGVQATASLEGAWLEAEQPARALEACTRQLAKLGGSEFRAESVEIQLEPLPFVPLSELNELRRRLVEALRQRRQEVRPNWRAEHLPNDFPFPGKSLTYLENVLNHKAEAFYWRHGVESIEPAAESGLDLHDRKVMTTRLCLKYELGACPKQPDTTELGEPLNLVDEDGNSFSLRFNCKECIMEVWLD